MKVLLIILNNRTNGVKTFTYHLYKSLASLGVDVEILKLHSRDEGISRKYVQDVYYRNTSIESLIAKAKTNPSITTTPAAEHKLEMQWLAEAGSKMMVHADFELDWNLPLGDKPIVVRKKLQRLVPGSIFIPHPYVRQFTKKVKKSKHAVSITRLDKRKGTGDILRAIMYNGADIDLYGDLMPFYGMFLNDNYPGWRKLWKGKFPTLEGANVVAPYKYMLDMTLLYYLGSHGQWDYTSYSQGVGRRRVKAWA